MFKKVLFIVLGLVATSYSWPTGMWDELQTAGLVFYVKSGGDDGSDGKSWASAKATIGSAVTACDAAGGGIVFIGPGSYDVTGSEIDFTSTTNGNPIMLIGSSAYNTTITSSSTTNPTITLEDGCRLKDLYIVNSGTSKSAVYALSKSNITIDGCYIRTTNASNYTPALYILSTFGNITGSANIVISNCLVSSDGVAAEVSGFGVIKNCTFSTSATAGSSWSSRTCFKGEFYGPLVDCSFYAYKTGTTAGGWTALYAGNQDFQLIRCYIYARAGASCDQPGVGIYVGSGGSLVLDHSRVRISNDGSSTLYSFAVTDPGAVYCNGGYIDSSDNSEDGDIHFLEIYSDGGVNVSKVGGSTPIAASDITSQVLDVTLSSHDTEDTIGYYLKMLMKKN